MKRNPLWTILGTYILALLLIIVLTLVTLKCNAQYDWKKQIAPAILVLVAGSAEGVMDGLQFHYDGNHPFWQPDISWRNKYKNKDPQQGKTFAGKYFVAATDGWHLMKFTRNATLFTAFTLKVGEKKKWWVYMAEIAGYWALNRIGFSIVYNIF